MKIIALTVLGLLVAGCGTEMTKDPGSTAALSPGSLVTAHWVLTNPDPALIPGAGGCYKLADEVFAFAGTPCTTLPSGFDAPDDHCDIACVDDGARAATVVLTCGKCTGQYAVSFAP